MRFRVLKFLLASALVTAGCDGGSGPSVGSASDAKQAGDIATAVGTQTAAGKKIDPRKKKKMEKMSTSPASPE